MQQFNQSERLKSYKKETTMSIIIPTYNESENISKLIEAIKDNLPYDIFTEIIVVDDNSPDGTGRIVENYVQDVVSIKNRSIAPTTQKIISKVMIILETVRLKLFIDQIREASSLLFYKESNLPQVRIY